MCYILLLLLLFNLCGMVDLEPAKRKLAPDFQVHISLPPTLTRPKTGNYRHVFVGGCVIFLYG